MRIDVKQLQNQIALWFKYVTSTYTPKDSQREHVVLVLIYNEPTQELKACWNDFPHKTSMQHTLPVIDTGGIETFCVQITIENRTKILAMKGIACFKTTDNKQVAIWQEDNVFIGTHLDPYVAPLEELLLNSDIDKYKVLDCAIPPDQWNEVVRLKGFAPPVCDHKPHLRYVVIETNRVDCVEYTTDGHRLAWHGCNAAPKESFKVVIPVELINFLGNFKKAVPSIRIFRHEDERHELFLVAAMDTRTTVYQKITSPTYPNIWGVIPSSSAYSMKLSQDTVKQLKDAITTVAVAADLKISSNEPTMAFAFTDHKITVSQNSDGNGPQITVPVAIDPPIHGTIIIIMNVKYLIEALNYTGECEIRVSDHKNAVLMQSPDKHNALTMPVRTYN